MIFLGPEFRRNIWTRFSLFSLAVMPILIGLGMIAARLSYITGQRISEAAGQVHRGLYYIPHHWSTALNIPSLTFFFIVAIVLGTYEAASAYTDEQKNKTWDLQKTSAIKPWHIVIGKLFGSTSYAWYFGFGLLATFLFGYSHHYLDVTTGITGKTMGPVIPQLKYADTHELLVISGYLILAAFAGHVVALFGSLKNMSIKKQSVFGSFIVGIAVSLSIFSMAFKHMSVFVSERYIMHANVTWSGYVVSHENFKLATILFFLFWLVIALYRYTRKELQFRNFPFVWLTFLITLSIYIVGFRMPGEKGHFIQFLPCFFVMFFITYGSLFQNSENISGYKRFFEGFKQRNARKFLEDFPLWLVSGLMLLIMTGLLFSDIRSLFTDLIGKQYILPDKFQNTENYVYVFILSMWLFLIRDGLVMHYFLLGERFKQGGFNIIIYYILMYGLIPMIYILSVNWRQVTAQTPEGENIRNVLGFFYPSLSAKFGWGLLPTLGEIVVVALLFWYSLRPKKLPKPAI